MTGNGTYDVYMEVVAHATWLGLAFPLLFLHCNISQLPQASALVVVTWVLVVSAFLAYMFSTGEIFPKIPYTFRRWIDYCWGVILLGLAGWLVWCTGGIGGSIFSWLFEYALILALIIRPTHEQHFLRQWRPVLFTLVTEALIIVFLASHPGGATMPNAPIPMASWGGGSIAYSLVVTGVLFWLSTIKLRNGVNDV